MRAVPPLRTRAGGAPTRIRAEAADEGRLTAREDSGEPSEVMDLAAPGPQRSSQPGAPDARTVRVGVERAPAPEPGFAAE